MSLSEIHARIVAKYATPVAPPAPPTEDALAGATATPLADGVLLEVAGRTLIAAPVRPFSLEELPAERAEQWAQLAAANKHMHFVSGRYVEGESANRNGALWSAGDLEFGALGVRGGPLNWLHQTTKVVGTLLDAELIPGRPALQSAAAETARAERPYIATVAALWPWVHPREVAAYVEHAAKGTAYQSMECISEFVKCGECGSQFPYAQTVQQASTVCPHMRERTATRQFINPSFLGAGTIIAPVEPGWANAHVSLMPTAARLAEAASAGAPDSMSTTDFELLVAAVIASV